jgi:hypothetical protein
MMHRLSTLITFIAVVALTTTMIADAFVAVKPAAFVRPKNQHNNMDVKTTLTPFQTMSPTMSTATTMRSSSTQLSLKIKLDPEASKKKVNPGAFKGAAYGGSIVVAVLLPLAFLVWAAVH